MQHADELQDLRNYLNDTATITPASQLRNYFETNCPAQDDKTQPLTLSPETAKLYASANASVAQND